MSWVGGGLRLSNKLLFKPGCGILSPGVGDDSPETPGQSLPPPSPSCLVNCGFHTKLLGYFLVLLCKSLSEAEVRV